MISLARYKCIIYFAIKSFDEYKWLLKKHLYNYVIIIHVNEYQWKAVHTSGVFI